jgi:hypothetical protein
VSHQQPRSAILWYSLPGTLTRQSGAEPIVTLQLVPDSHTSTVLWHTPSSLATSGCVHPSERSDLAIPRCRSRMAFRWSLERLRRSRLLLMTNASLLTNW